MLGEKLTRIKGLLTKTMTKMTSDQEFHDLKSRLSSLTILQTLIERHEEAVKKAKADIADFEAKIQAADRYEGMDVHRQKDVVRLSRVEGLVRNLKDAQNNLEALNTIVEEAKTSRTELERLIKLKQ